MGKIKNVKRNRVRDLLAVLAETNMVSECPGGRPILSGYICVHCGADPSLGECDGVVGFVKAEDRKRQRRAA